MSASLQRKEKRQSSALGYWTPHHVGHRIRREAGLHPHRPAAEAQVLGPGRPVCPACQSHPRRQPNPLTTTWLLPLPRSVPPQTHLHLPTSRTIQVQLVVLTHLGVQTHGGSRSLLANAAHLRASGTPGVPTSLRRDRTGGGQHPGRAPPARSAPRIGASPGEAPAPPRAHWHSACPGRNWAHGCA